MAPGSTQWQYEHLVDVAQLTKGPRDGTKKKI